MSFFVFYALFMAWFGLGIAAAFFEEPKGWKVWLYGPGVWIVEACWEAHE